MVGKRLSEVICCAAFALLLMLATPCAFAQIPIWGSYVTNGQFQFHVPGLNGTFVVQSSTDMVNWSTIQTNTRFSLGNLINIPATNSANYYRVATRVVQVLYPINAYALAAVGNININGNHLLTDSYNSTDPNLSTNGQYDSTKTSTNGSVASVGGVVNPGASTFKGNLFLGPTASYVGTASQFTGSIFYDYNIQFPPATLPTTDTNGDAITWQNSPGSSSSHTYTTNGYYTVNDSGTITVSNGVSVTLHITATSFTPSSITINGGNTNSGSIVMYQDSGSAILPSNASGGPIGNRPVNFIYYGLPGLTSVTLAGTSDFVGAIYATEASIAMNGGGLSVNVYGSIVVHNASDNGHYFLHFDEGLLTPRLFGTNYVYTWP